jgi:(1->4)-alpha-D-glucan 1-alpha-D-glucosylmutase
MNATATHDTKRGEDVRARINLLSEIPDEWERKLRRWGRWNAAKRSVVQGRPVPDRNEEILIYQTLFGAWPLAASEMPAFRRRIGAYLLKTAREAKVHTSWLYPNREYEEALVRFVNSISAPRSRSRFLDDFRRFQARYALSGALNGLAQVVLQIAAPGVPDIYQGAELWNLSLVDPDNRRPVDFGRRMRLLHRLRRDYFVDRDALLGDLLGNWRDGRIKLYLIWKALRFRRARPELFVKGSYLPIAAHGARRRHVSAFIRRRRGDWALAAAPRLVAGLGARSRPPLGSRVWGETALILPGNAPEHWYNTLTGETAVARRVAGGKRRLRLDELFARFPVALLAGGEAAG